MTHGTPFCKHRSPNRRHYRWWNQNKYPCQAGKLYIQNAVLGKKKKRVQFHFWRKTVFHFTCIFQAQVKSSLLNSCFSQAGADTSPFFSLFATRQHPVLKSACQHCRVCSLATARTFPPLNHRDSTNTTPAGWNPSWSLSRRIRE